MLVKLLPLDLVLDGILTQREVFAALALGKKLPQINAAVLALRGRAAQAAVPRMRLEVLA